VALYHVADALDWLTVLRSHALYYVAHSIPFWPVFCQFGFDFGESGTFLGEVLSFIQGEIVAALAFLFNLLVGVANYIISGVNFTFGFFDTLARDLKKWGSWLWEQLAKIGLAKLIKGLRDALAALKRFVDRVVKWLLKIRKWYDQYFNQFVKPVLNAIRHLRQVLQIFRLLGFKWAARLDARLATIENRIVAAYELLRINLNKAVSFLQLIADPFGILRRNPALAAIIKQAGEIKNVLDRETNHVETQKELDASNHDNVWFQKSGQAGMTAYFKGGPKPQSLIDAEADWNAAVAEMPSLANQSLSTEDNGIEFQ
jgi:hypothetical protein